MLMSSYVIATVPFRAVLEAEGFQDGEENTDIRNQTIIRNQALWLREYAQGPFLDADGSADDHLLVTLSRVEEAGNHVYVADNDIVRDMLEVEFDLGQLLRLGGKLPFLFSIEDRYSPDNVHLYIVKRGDHRVAEMYDLNFMIISSTEKSPANMIQFIIADRYYLFCDMDIMIYHYGYFG